MNITSPVVLESTIEGNGFICQDQTPLYVFTCTLYSNDLIWIFNNDKVTAFLGSDEVGRTHSISYPRNAIFPVYNITAVLTHNNTYCVSELTVRQFNGSEVEVIPFTVSCQTFCMDLSEVCQTKHYDIAGNAKISDVVC